MRGTARKRQWKYDTKTEGAVEAALLRLLAKKPLADVTVSELAREANVSRSTFYEHYGNPVDVYDALVGEFARRVSPMMDQLTCADGNGPKGRPFCSRIRESKGFGPLVDDDRFLSTFLSQERLLEHHDLYGMLRSAGYTALQARSVCAFQLSGCFSTAKTAVASPEKWEDVRATLDCFIRGGISACLAAKREPGTQDGAAEAAQP